jgi:rubrerythrin
LNKEKLKSLKAQMEIAIIAVGRERQAQQFYLEASKTAYNEESKELLITLANEEKKHLEKVEKMLENITALYNEEKKLK